MTILQALALGILQGLTEFLPVSSSGHLVLAETFFGLHVDPVSMQGFDVLLHAGTLLALLTIYRETWWKMLRSFVIPDKESRTLLYLLVLATIPGALIGFYFEETIAVSFRTVSSVAAAFIVTAIVLVLADRFSERRSINKLSIVDILFIGVAQACALVPGLSRSGLTISAGRMLGVRRGEALDFSFLMLAPIIAGATVLTLKDATSASIVLPQTSVTVVGFLTSFLASVAAILFLRRFVISHKLAWFAVYLIPVAILLLTRG